MMPSNCLDDMVQKAGMMPSNCLHDMGQGGWYDAFKLFT